jgi:hypothetical protein
MDFLNVPPFVPPLLNCQPQLWLHKPASGQHSTQPHRQWRTKLIRQAGGLDPGSSRLSGNLPRPSPQD